jgi:hypothetical protein
MPAWQVKPYVCCVAHDTLLVPLVLQHECTAVVPLFTDATVELPYEQRTKGFMPKPAIPVEYRLEAPLPLANASSPDQDNPIVFYDIW